MISDIVYLILNICGFSIISYLLYVLLNQIWIDWNIEHKIIRNEYIPGTFKNLHRNIPPKLEIPNKKMGEIRKWI